MNESTNHFSCAVYSLVCFAHCFSSANVTVNEILCDCCACDRALSPLSSSCFLDPVSIQFGENTMKFTQMMSS